MKNSAIKALVCGVVFAGLLICLSLETLAQTNASWPQWRGANRDGISKETGLLKQWPESGPPLLWKASGAGFGYGAAW
jgi:outer membrane protein assembly factor BamB